MTLANHGSQLKHYFILRGSQQPDICQFQLFKKLGTEKMLYLHVCVFFVTEIPRREEIAKVTWCPASISLMVQHSQRPWGRGGDGGRLGLILCVAGSLDPSQSHATTNNRDSIRKQISGDRTVINQG